MHPFKSLMAYDGVILVSSLASMAFLLLLMVRDPMDVFGCTKELFFLSSESHEAGGMLNDYGCLLSEAIILVASDEADR